jgi:hypothetical protein
MDGEYCFPFPPCAIRLPPKLSMKVSVHNADWAMVVGRVKAT